MAELIDANEIMFTPFEPKLQNRFIMYVEGVPAYLIKKVARPSITFEEVTLDHINIQRYVKKYSYPDFTIGDVERDITKFLPIFCYLGKP